MVFLYVISFIALCEFSFLEATKLPDNGRLMVGRCLDNLFLRDRNPMRGVENYLFGLCDKTKDDSYHIVHCINDKIPKSMDIGPVEAFDKLKTCLGKYADILVERYKKFAFNSGHFNTEEEFQKYPEIVQVVKGLCANREWVRYKELDRNEKMKALNCFRSCTVNLFQAFEQSMENIEIQYQNYLILKHMQDAHKSGNEKEETSEKPLDQIEAKKERFQADEAHHSQEGQLVNQEQQNKEPYKIENDKSIDDINNEESLDDKKENRAENSAEEHKNQNIIYEEELGWFDRLKKLLQINQEQYEYKKGIENYEKTCKKSRVQGINTMTTIGKIWGENYIEDILDFYDNKFYSAPNEYDVKYALKTYLYCARWKCAMGDYDDIPLENWVAILSTSMRLRP